MKRLYEWDVVKRSAVLWVAFMVTLWVVFAIGALTHPQAWENVPTVTVETGWPVFLYVIGMNGLLMLLITAGNLFVRFGAVTPGLLILTYNAVSIGWIAGTNAFTEPFASIAQANAAFARIGFWETTAYVLICAVTLPKSLYVAPTFPATQWSEVRAWRDLRLNRSEVLVTALALASLLIAAAIEAVYRG